MNRKLLSTSLLMATLAMGACGGGGDDDAPAPGPEPSGPLAVDTQFGHQGKLQVSLAPFGGVVSVHELPDGKLLLLGHRQLESTVVASDPVGASERVPHACSPNACWPMVSQTPVMAIKARGNGTLPVPAPTPFPTAAC